MSLALSVLDQSPIAGGRTPADAIRDTLKLAQAADRLGYRRYWIAEHHNSGGLASAAPEVLIGAVAGVTERIRVGSGGIMLSHYSPLKVAEQFRMLEALHPGRIDLGVGRAPGSDSRTALALATGPGRLGIEHYPEQLMDLYGFLADDLPQDHPFKGIKASPAGESMPELWLLGSSGASARYAAELGWGFCFAHFINPEGGARFVESYRQGFEPSPVLREPRVSVGIAVTCADTNEEAERLSWSRWGWRIMSAHGAGSGIPSPWEAMAFAYTEPERDYLAHLRQTSIWGNPAHVKERMEALAAEYGAEELVVVTITHDFDARVRSYELLAGVFDLPALA